MADAAREDLASYVRRVREQVLGVSLEAVEQRARARGYKISRGYISQIENRYLSNPSTTKLQALAAGLGVNPEEIFAVARGKALGPMSPRDFDAALEALGVEQFQAFGGTQNLTDEDRREIVAMLTTMVEQRLIRRQGTKRPPEGGRKK